MPRRPKRKGPAGMGTVFQRSSDGRWQAKLRLGVDVDGKARVWTGYGKTEEEAKNKLLDAINLQRQGELVASPNQTVAEYLQIWLRNVRASLRPKTWDSYRLNVNRVTPHIGKYRLVKLTAPHIQAAYTKLLVGLSHRSVRQAHTVLHTALEQARQQLLIPRNPCDATRPPKPDEKPMATFSVEQVQTLFERTDGERWYPLWVVLATSGLRLGEACGLRWADVDLEDGLLILQQAMQRQSGKGLVAVPVKTHRARRAVELGEYTTDVLRDLRKEQLELRQKAGPEWNDHDLVFTCLNGNPLDPSRVNHVWHTTLKRLGLPDIRPHDLRHTAASVLLRQKVHPRLVQELLGHSSIQTTIDTYSHVIRGTHSEVGVQMDQLFRTKRTKKSEKSE